MTTQFNGSRPSTGSAAPSYSSRAERFEDEKRRIIESCFNPNKKDAEQRVLESYITHLRVEEDAVYPSQPAPRDAGPEQKKPRVIIIAVRNTGRVRMHKARENHNLTFSIGKTWNLEELDAVTSFSYIEPGAKQSRVTDCERAGALGFTVTIGKPYFWTAATTKERDFFIASLVKIYRKYTKGREPRLEGFSDAEKATMFGYVPGQSQTSLNNPPDPTSLRNSVSNDSAPPPSAFSQSSISRSSAAREPYERTASTDRYQANTPLAHSETASQQSEYRAGYRPRSPVGRLSQATYSSNDRSAYPINERFTDQASGRDSYNSDDRYRRPSRDNYYPTGAEAIAASRGPASPQSSRFDVHPHMSQSPTASTSSRATAASTKPRPISPQAARHYPGAAMSPGGDGMYGGSLAGHPADRDRSDPTSPDVPNDTSVAADDRFDDLAPLAASRFDPNSQPLPERRRPPLDQQFSSRVNDASELRPSSLAISAPNASDRSRSDRMPGAFYESAEATGSGAPDRPPSNPAPTTPPLPSPDHVDAGGYPVSPSAIAPQADRMPAFEVAPEPTPGPEPVLEPGPEPLPDTEREQRAGPDREAQRDPEPVPEEDDGEEYRPGLGPMVKKKLAADKFRKAANTINAFKPRARGNQDALKVQTSPAKDLLGIKSSVSRNVSYDVSTPDVLDIKGRIPDNPFIKRDLSTPADPVELREPQSADYTVQRALPDETTDAPLPKLRSRQQEKYLASLGIDPAVLNSRGVDFESALADFGWDDRLIEAKDLDKMQSDIKREIGRVESGSWLGMMDRKDSRVEMVDKLLDKAIAECDELDGLLTIYGVELGTLNDDIAFIEAQSQGLQVQTANQKILQGELQSLVGTISMDTKQLQSLQRASFDTDLESMEQTLAILYRAMMTLDPTIKDAAQTDQKNDRADDSTAERRQLASMNALREKRQQYQDESLRFAQRLAERLEGKFNQTLSQAIPALTRASKTQPQASSCNAARSELWKYSPILLFVKEMTYPAWQQLTEKYAGICTPLYSQIFKGAVDAQKKLLRVPSGDEADLLFTAVEKEHAAEGLAASATRKLTMKRSQILPKTTRTASDRTVNVSTQPGRKMPFEMFSDMISSWAPIMVMEQNFVVKLFHATSLENVDFADAIRAQPPDARGEPVDLKLPMQMDPDRGTAEHVTRIMSTVFDFWPGELRALVDLVVTNEPLQAVGVLASMAVYSFPLHEKSTEFLLRTMTEASTRLRSVFERFIDEQIRAIEETKVKIKKRRGVIGFVRTFPQFSMAVENMFGSVTRPAGWNSSILEVRKMIDDAYARICQSMWSSLKQIAQDSPSAAGGVGAGIGVGVGGAAGGGTAGQGSDAEDKVALNYNVLLVENFHHFASEVETGEFEDSVLGKWRAKAVRERDEHVDMYVRQVIRRPLGKLLDFVESTESLVKEAEDKERAVAAIAQKPSHSRAAAKKAMAGYDGREIRKGIEALRKRVEKHFGDGEGHADDAATQRLVALVLNESSSEYVKVLERVQQINRKLYAGAEGERGLEVEWSKEDVNAAFRKTA